MRKVTLKRKTKETEIIMKLNINGCGDAKVTSKIGFLNHMIESFAQHGLFDIEAQIKGDLNVDQHHLVEDIGISLGKIFDKALKKRKGLNRTGFFIYPMDESLCRVSIDLSGRPYLKMDVKLKNKKLGDFYTENLTDFFLGFVNNLGCALHIKVFYGRSDHHKLESVFKALGKAMKQAMEREKRLKGKVPSTKGVL